MSDPTVPTAGRHDPLAALRIPYVRAFAIGRVFAVLGWQIVQTALGWQLYERTGDPWSLGLIGLLQLLPVLVLMIPVGHAVDRIPRRRIVATGTAVAIVAFLSLAWVSWRGGSTFTIYVLCVVIGVGRAILAPSVSTILPQLLSREQFANTNAWISTTFQVASIAGPAVGGGLIWLTGDATVAYVAGAGGEAVFLWMLTRIPGRSPPPRAGRYELRDLFAGFAFVRSNRIFLGAITLDLLAVLVGGVTALLPVFAKDILHTGPAGLGWLRAAPALGALAMALLATRLRPWERPGRALLIAVAGFGVATIGFGLSRNMGLSLLCLFLTGFFDTISVVIRMTLEQVITPDALRGRVSAVNYVFVGCSNELGAFESGAAAALFGPVPAVVGGGVGTLLVVLGVIRWFPALVRIGPLHTLSPPAEPAIPVVPSGS